jgi:hypothetical protein
MTTPDSDPSIQELLERFTLSSQNRLQTSQDKLRNEIIPSLMASGVANVEAAYSGYGDSGAIDGVQFRDKSGVRVEREKIPAVLTEKLENALYEFLPAGFEINDGGQGTLTLDVQTGRLTLQHQENETVSNDSTSEWEV